MSGWSDSSDLTNLISPICASLHPHRHLVAVTMLVGNDDAVVPEPEGPEGGLPRMRFANGSLSTNQNNGSLPVNPDASSDRL